MYDVSTFTFSHTQCLVCLTGVSENEFLIAVFSVTGADVEVMRTLHWSHLTDAVVIIQQILTVKQKRWIMTHSLYNTHSINSPPET